VDKHRLELFSDGVFAIVLTLMVLELKTPELWDITGLSEMAPGLLVHALAFLIVGNAWISHHNYFIRVRRVDQGTLWTNLFCLFCVTLIPFATRLAIENPAAPLGAMIMSLCFGGLSFGGLLMVRYFCAQGAAPAAHELDYARKFKRVTLTFAVASLILAGLCWVSVWFGYIGLLALALGLIAVRQTVVNPAGVPAEHAARDGKVD
jgi:uncharacterized membrane protein